MKTTTFMAVLFLAHSGISNAMQSPHYNELGFFDIHVCNWPERPPFFLALYSTYQYNDVEKIEIFDPHDKFIASLNLNKFRVMKTKKGEKRAFLNHIDIPDGSENGWYKVKATLVNGKEFFNKDYVVLDKLPRATGHKPVADTELAVVPKKLIWEKVPGAQFYQVFIRDFWNDEKVIFSSPLLNKPELDVPKDLLKKGGWYGWRVHARDSNEHVLLGDFNHGSLSEEIRFSIVE